MTSERSQRYHITLMNTRGDLYKEGARFTTKRSHSWVLVPLGALHHSTVNNQQHWKFEIMLHCLSASQGLKQAGATPILVHHTGQNKIPTSGPALGQVLQQWKHSKQWNGIMCQVRFSELQNPEHKQLSFCSKQKRTKYFSNFYCTCSLDLRFGNCVTDLLAHEDNILLCSVQCTSKVLCYLQCWNILQTAILLRGDIIVL